MSNSSPIASSSPAYTGGRREAASPPGALAFLVHSQETVANRMPPEVDNKALARQKRRRTSKEDEDILKAEYLKNPKPDKTARLEIISKVALGEKEVTIWFQNRRQHDRRRARPLEPSLMSSSSTMSDPPTEEEANMHVSEHVLEQQPEPRSDRAATPDLTSDGISHAPLTEFPTEEDHELQKPATEDDIEQVTNTTTENCSGETVPVYVHDSQSTVAESQNASQSRTSWISNRRSASFVRNSEDYAAEAIAFPNAPPKPFESPEVATSTSRPLKRAHSFVRLSTNEDGSARIVTDLDKTPSPPHAKTNPATFSRAAAGLRRSYSAAGLTDRLVAARGEPSPKMPRTSSNIGRSRDSRTWEFWCDPDSRSTTSLTTRAEQEGSGSAADAIGILRANRKILAQNHARQNQNTPLLSRHGSHKVLGSPGVKKSRSPMKRASTISGRISHKEYSKKGSDDTESEDLPQTESDKENWGPNMPKGSQRDYEIATPRAARRARQILGENPEVMSQASSIGAMLARERGKGLVDPEQDDELRGFMNGGSSVSGRSSINSAEEAGCVEGLLALSQGQWR